MTPERQIILLDHGQEEKNPNRGEEELYLSLPYSDFNGWIYTNDPLFEVSEHIDLFRLKGIRSLANLSPIIPGIDVRQQYLSFFDHDRRSHTILVASVGNQILENNKFSKKDIKKYIIGAFFHDDATPAYGDSTKFVDMENLHEELFWQEVVDQKTEEYISSVGITHQEIDDIIKNNGILGEVLDIADRITYVMQDSQNAPFLHNSIQSNDNDSDYLRSKKMTIGNIYKDVMIDSTSGSVYLSDPSHLYDFLLLRCLLHKNIYLHPINQGRDMLIAKTIKPFYSTTDNGSETLTPQRLRTMTDWELIRFLAQKLKKEPTILSMELTSWYPQKYEKFNDLGSAQSRSIELEKNGKKVFGIKESRGFKTGAKYNVLSPSGEILTFEMFDPERSLYLQNIADSTKGFYIYYED